MKCLRPAITAFVPIAALAATTIAPTAFAQTQLSEVPVTGGEIQSFTITPDGSSVLYLGDLTTDNVVELFSASTSAAGTQIKINNNPPGAGGEVIQFRPSGSSVVYRGDLTTTNEFELYGASVSASGTQFTISSNPVSNGSVNSFSVAADGTIVAYTGSLDSVTAIELYSASTFIPGTQIKLNAAPVAGGGVSTVILTPDGSRAIYTGDLNADNVIELYSASASATGTQIKLNDTPAINGDVLSVFVTPDGSRALYGGDINTNSVFELFSASTTEAGTQFTVNETPVSGGRVTQYNATPDSSRVIYVGDLDTDGVFELYSASASTSNTQIKISDAPPAGGGVRSNPTPFLLTPDSSRVVYSGDLTTDEVFELYSASTSTPGTQTRLTETPVTDGDIDKFLITPNGSRAVYSGDLTTDDVFELYAASTSTAGTQTKLTNFPADADIFGFAITPDGRFAVFPVSDPLGETLHYVDVSGLTAPVSLTTPSAHGAEINQFAITPDSRKVIFLADLDEDEAFNLYSVDLPAPPTPVAPAARPTIKVTGKKTIKTSRKRLTIRGTATSTAGIQKVEFKVPGAKFRKTKGTTLWRAVIRQKKKRTPVKFRAIAADGQSSSVSKVIIKQK